MQPFAPNQPLEIEEIDLEGPKEGEVLVRIVTLAYATRTCLRYLAKTQRGFILGHEGCGIVEEVGKA